MKIELRKYSSDDYTELHQLLESEGEEWKEYLTPKYQVALEKSVTYVAIADQRLCGYVRSREDFGLFIWVIDLLVHRDFRGHSLGKKLLERTAFDFPGQDVFVLSDVDEYYEKQGYTKEGSVYQVNRPGEG